MTTPELSLQQRRAGLKRANEIRTYRARLKTDLKAGRRSIDSLLTHPPEEILTAKVSDLLLAVPKYGRIKVNKALTQSRISPSKTYGGLTDRQRMELLRLIRQTDADLDAGREQRHRLERAHRDQHRSRVAA